MVSVSSYLYRSIKIGYYLCSTNARYPSIPLPSWLLTSQTMLYSTLNVGRWLLKGALFTTIANFTKWRNTIDHIVLARLMPNGHLHVCIHYSWVLIISCIWLNWWLLYSCSFYCYHYFRFMPQFLNSIQYLEVMWMGKALHTHYKIALYFNVRD